MGRCRNIIKLWFNLSDLYAYGPELYKCHCYWKYLKFNYVYGSELCYYYYLRYYYYEIYYSSCYCYSRNCDAVPLLFYLYKNLS